MIGVKFRLEGVTTKGKNRIREHGEWWEVLAVSDSVSSIKGTSSYLLNAETTGYLKWGSSARLRDNK